MSADQAGVVQQAEPSGIRAEWCPRLGTPLSIRGPNLGRRQLYSGGQGLALKGGGKYEQDAVAVLDNLARFYRLQDAEKEFAAKPAEADSLGYHHVRLKQVYQGLRVFGGDLIVHFDRSGQAYEVNGQYVPDLQVDVVPGWKQGKRRESPGKTWRQWANRTDSWRRNGAGDFCPGCGTATGIRTDVILRRSQCRARAVAVLD